MQDVLNLYKPLGWTPLATIKRFQELHPEYQNLKMTYAGRLDPMAEGVLLVLAGEAVHDKEAYLKIDKRYTAEILLGVTTDSYDALGLVQDVQSVNVSLNVNQELKQLEGTHNLPYPPYSSHVVKGKPLFAWTREGKLHEIQVPNRVMTVYEAHVKDSRSIATDKLLQTVTGKINLITGDFRQTETLQRWREVLSDNSMAFTVVTVDFKVASGTYIRSLAHELGKRLNCGASLLNLTRTAVGDHNIAESKKLI